MLRQLPSRYNQVVEESEIATRWSSRSSHKLLSRMQFFLQFLVSAAVPGLMTATFFCLLNPTVEAATHYVDSSASGSNNGSSWSDAYTDLQTALGVSVSGDEVWVAQGVYIPGLSESDTFQLKNGVEVYGGFEGVPGTEGNFGASDFESFVSVLSGDIAGDDTTNSDWVVTNTGNISGSNTDHVVTGNGTNGTAILDGFTVTAGHANGGGLSSKGAGMTNIGGSPALSNINFTGNRAEDNGGGMHNETGSSLSLTNVKFTNNSAGNFGGGMFNETASSPSLTNVVFLGNSATSDGGGMQNRDNSSPTMTNSFFLGNTSGANGGALFNRSSSPVLINVVFSGNYTNSDGGAMYNQIGSHPVLTNVTLANNSSGFRGGGIYNIQDSDPRIRNSILWGNHVNGNSSQIHNDSGDSVPIASDNLIEGGCPFQTTCNGTLLTSNPLVVDADGPDNILGTMDDDLTLSVGSPAIDAGNNAHDPDPNNSPPDSVLDIPTDAAGNTRIENTDVDLGALESPGPNSPPVCDAGGPYLIDCDTHTPDVQLGGSGSSDPNGDPLTYAWSTDCPSATFDDSTIENPVLSISAMACILGCNITLVVSDGVESVTCSTSLSGIDNVAPVLTLPADITLECDSPTDPTSAGMASAIDACDPNPSVSHEDAIYSGTCDEQVVIVRTWTATDACGNTSSQDQTITVIDTTAPTVTCPGDITVTNDPGECGAIVNFSATGSDNCGAATITYSQDPGTLFPVGTTEVTVTATDSCGNASQCTFEITVNDTEDPVVVSPADIEVGNDPGGTSFQSGTVISNTGDGPVAVFAADLDGDGDEDVVSAMFNDSTIVWNENTDGLGNFGPDNLISTLTTGAFSVFAGDIDGDGDLDVFSASRGDDKVAWYENRLSEVSNDFGPQQLISANADFVHCVIGADLDGDGDLDAISASVNDDKVAWYENTDGLGSFSSEKIITLNADMAISIFAKDLDGDGDLDVVSASISDDKVAWYENRLDEVTNDFGGEQVVSTSRDAANGLHVGDVDGDGDADIIAGSRNDDTIAWYENTDGLGTFGTEIPISVGDADGVISIFGGDVDGDGDIDVFSASENDNVIAWYENTDGLGNFGPQQIITASSGGAQWVTGGDLNGDGNLDAIAAAGSVDEVVWYENETSAGGCGAIVDFTSSATDNCPGVVSGCDHASGDSFPVGVTTITCSATDTSGNTSQCNFTITVNDTEDPIITCPGDVTIECDDDEGPGSTGWATATDNCDNPPTLTYFDSDASGTCPGSFVITRTWTATDSAGNSASCVQIITVVDTTVPVLAIPSDVAIECDEDDTPISTGQATATDNCDASPTVTYTDDVTSTTCPSVIIRTWMAVDTCWNVVSGAQTITIGDTTAPELSGVPADATVECDGIPSAVTPSVADNCDPSPIVVLKEVRNVIHVNQAGLGDALTINEALSMLDYNDGVDDLVLIDPGVYDEQLTPNGDAGADSFEFPDIDNLTLAAVEASYSSHTDSLSLRGSDPNNPPVLTVVNAPTVNYGFFPDEPIDNHLAGLSLCGNNVTFENVEIRYGSGSTGGPQTYAMSGQASGIVFQDCLFTNGLSSSDVSGDFFEVQNNIELTSNLNPTVGADNEYLFQNSRIEGESLVDGSVYPRSFVWFHGYGQGSVFTGLNPTGSLVFEGCVIKNPAKRYLAMMRGHDGSGSGLAETQIRDCYIQSVNSGDSLLGWRGNQGPAVVERNIFDTATTANGLLRVRRRFVENISSWTVSDNVFVDVNLPIQTQFNHTTSTIPDWRVVNNTFYDYTDAAIRSEGSSSGSLLVANNIVVGTGTGTQGTGVDIQSSGSSLVDLESNLFWNNSSDVNGTPNSQSGTIVSDPLFDNTTLTEPSEPGDVFPGNPFGLTSSSPARDSGSNASVVGTGDVDRDERVHLGTVDIGAQEYGAQPLPISGTDPSGGEEDNFILRRIWTAIDVCGNSATAEQILTVLDTTDPILNIPPDLTIECNADSTPASTGQATAMDNCDENPVVTYTDSTVPGPCANSSIITRTWRAEDATGNFSVADQTITVVDTTPPTALCDDFTAVIGSDGTVTITGDDIDNGSSDNCGQVTLSVSPDTFTCIQQGNHLVTLTVTDACGLTDTCQATVTVTDPNNHCCEIVSITCPPEVTVECDVDLSPANLGSATPAEGCPDPSTVIVTHSDSIASGTCPQNYVISRVWTATDGDANTDSCTQTITVRDTTPPDVQCSAPVNLVADENCEAVVPDLVSAATLSDNCSNSIDLVLTQTPPAGSVIGHGITPVVIAATDECGNFAACTVDVEVLDQTPPVITPPAEPTVVPIDCDFTVVFEDPSVTDNCDASPEVSCQPPSGSILGPGLHNILCSATDASGNTSEATFTLTVLEPLQVIFEQPPLRDDNVRDDIETDADDINKFKVGRTIPVKVKILDCDGNDLTTTIASSVTVRLDATEREYQGPTSTVVNDVPEDFNGVGDLESTMVLTGNHFQYNLDTDGFDTGTIQDPNRFFRIHVTVEYNTDPLIVVGEEDALLESK